MATALGAVQTISLAPPSFDISFEASSTDESMKLIAPSDNERSFLFGSGGDGNGFETEFSRRFGLDRRVQKK
jgi:hypothetical protein